MKNYCIREILHNMVINDFYFPCYFDNSSYIFDGKELKKKSSIGDSKLDVYIKNLKLFFFFIKIHRIAPMDFYFI